MTTLLRGGRVYEGDQFQPLDIAIDGGRIVTVGPSIRPADTDDIWDLDGDLVIPGLVNAHYHSPDNLLTGRLPVVPLELWSLSSVPGRGNDPRELHVAALLGAAELLRGGVTGVVDMVRPSAGLTLSALDSVADAYLQSGIRAAIVPVVRDLRVEDTLPLDGGTSPAAPELDGAEQLDVLRAFAESWHGRDGRISVQVGPSAPQRCSDALLRDALDLAATLRTLLHTHVLETHAQAVQAERRWGTTMVKHLDRAGALSERVVLAHVVWPAADEIDLVAERGALVVHNPASNCALGSGRAPIPAMLTAGVRLALGTDAATCNDGLSMFEALKLGAILHRPFEANWKRWPTPATTLEMATHGGAAALDMIGQLGRIASGYIADVVVLDCRAAAFVPPNDFVHQLVMRADAGVVRHVFVAGKPVVRDRQLLTMDWSSLAAEASAMARGKAATQPRPDGAIYAAVEQMLRDLRSA